MNEDNMDAALADLEATSQRLIGAVQGMATRLNTTEQVTQALQAHQQAIDEQQANTKTQRTINGWLMLSIALDVILSIALGVGAVRIDHNADSIAVIQSRTSTTVLCPLYSIFLTSVNTPRPELVNTPEKKKAFEHAAQTIREGYTALGCLPRLKG